MMRRGFSRRDFLKTAGGARLRDILNKAGIKAGSVDVSFDGLDRAPLPSVPDFVKSLPVDKALEDDILVAYEMNGEYMPLLNGFPARLVVPGWYATYWVKGLTDITVLPKQFEGFWVKTAYRIPDTACGCIPPVVLSVETRHAGKIHLNGQGYKQHRRVTAL